MQGEGVLIYGSGDRYEGEFYQGVANGKFLSAEPLTLKEREPTFF